MEPGGQSHLETAAQVVVDLLVACGILGVVGGVVGCTLALPAVLGDLSALRLDLAVDVLWPGLALCSSGALSFAGVLLARGWRRQRRVWTLPVRRSDGPWWQAAVVQGEPPLELLMWPLMAAPPAAAGNGAHAGNARPVENGRQRGEGAGSAQWRGAQLDKTHAGPLRSVSRWLIGETPAPKPSEFRAWALKTWTSLAHRASRRTPGYTGEASPLHGSARRSAGADGRRTVPHGPATRRRRATRR